MTVTSGLAIEKVTPEEARAIAKDAYIYGYPLVDSYRILYSYFVDRNDAEYRGPWNEVHNTARVFTPADTAMQTPNSDTPYSQLGLDLRAEPMVLSVPTVEGGRYYSLECNDLYTYIFDYIGTRATGNEAGHFLIAGPGWSGATPPGIKKVIPCETELAFIFYRTQLFSPDDIENVKKVQAGYGAQPLSAFLGQPAPPAASPIHFFKPLTAEEQKASLRFFEELNFILGFCPTHPSEKALRERFARLGIGSGGDFDANALSPEMRSAIEQGRADAWEAFEVIGHKMLTGEMDTSDVFGSRDTLGDKYVNRMVGTDHGIWGNAEEEALYGAFAYDTAGEATDGSKHLYRIRFPAGGLPPVNAFWSLTMYSLPARLLVENPIDRYLINSAMLPDLKRDLDGAITIDVQHESPGPDRESNWLPAPDGPFLTGLRMYWPKAEVLDRSWKQPPMERID